MNLRPATLDDAALLLEWANDPDVRAASFNSEPIGAVEHVKWLAGRLPQGMFWIAELETPIATWAIGYARIDRTGDKCGEIAVSVIPELRGKGLGRRLIRRAIEQAWLDYDLIEIQARVKTENESSLIAFTAAGFVADGEDRFVWRP